MGKQPLSHRYNLLPLLRSRPGGVQRELIVKDLPTANVAKEFGLQNPKQLFLAIFCTFCDNGLRFNGLYFNKN
jgi:hypothetical protein